MAQIPEVAVEITNLTVGTAANFRNTLNTNLNNLKSALETAINTEETGIAPVVNALQTSVSTNTANIATINSYIGDYDLTKGTIADRIQDGGVIYTSASEPTGIKEGSYWFKIIT